MTAPHITPNIARDLDEKIERWNGRAYILSADDWLLVRGIIKAAALHAMGRPRRARGEGARPLDENFRGAPSFDSALSEFKNRSLSLWEFSDQVGIFFVECSMPSSPSEAMNHD